MTCASACCESKVKAHQCECVNNFNYENMSNEQMTLTAEEIFFQHTEGTHYAFFSEEDRDAFYVEMPRAMEAYANQQAAQVQEELEQVKAQRGELSKWVKHLKPFVILPAEIKREIETLLSSLEK